MSTRATHLRGRARANGAGASRLPGTHCPGVVDWIAPMFTPTGYGDEARGFAKHLRRLGYPLRAVPVDTVLGFAEQVAAEDPAFFTDLVASMDLAGAGPRVGVLHLPATAPFRPVSGADYTIARTMFETDGLHPSSVENLNTVDEVWVPSQFNLETFRAAGVRVPIAVVGAGVDARRFHPGLSPLPISGRRGTVFLSMFEWSHRKGWDVLLRSWSLAFGALDDATLVLRTYPRSMFENVGDAQRTAELMVDAGLASLGLDRSRLAPIVVLGAHLPPSDVPRLVAAADCYVAPSRGEGWGRPQHEAMATGRPVIATRWSANLEFMNDDNSLLVDVERMVPVDDDMDVAHYRGQHWAEPSAEHLARLLALVAADPARARSIGARARSDVERAWQWKTAAAHAGERLEAVVGALAAGEAVPPPDAQCAVAPAALRTDPRPGRDPGAGGARVAGDTPAPSPSLVLADARELLDDERILATYAAASSPDVDLALVVYGPGLDPVAYESSLRALASRCDVDLDGGPRVIAILPPSDGDAQREEIAAKVVGVLSGRGASGRFASLPALRVGVPGDLRAAAAPGSAGPAPRSVSGPLVSVLVPVHNHAEYLAQCLDSVLAQTYDNLEIVVVDDCSLDDARRVAERYARVDERVRLEPNRANLGLVGNHRRCLELATGEYVKFVHTDDRLRPTAVARLVAAATSRAGVSVATSARDVIDGAGRPLVPIASTSRLAEADTVFAGVMVADLVLEHGVNFVGEPSTAMFRRDAMRPEEFSTYRGQEFTSLLDVSTWIALLERGDVAYVAEPQSELRLHDGQYGRELGGVVEHLEWLELVGRAHDAGRLAEPERFARALEGLSARLVHMAFVARGTCAEEVGEAVREALERVAQVHPSALGSQVSEPSAGGTPGSRPLAALAG
ncbi:MAG TPA: glycosyltransferase [Acidimicrobiales bacterium]|nr:glycosyltransferase [Acidimicrobiales bacterium]